MGCTVSPIFQMKKLRHRAGVMTGYLLSNKWQNEDLVPEPRLAMAPEASLEQHCDPGVKI